MKEKWRHLARTVLRLAQNYISYATKKTGIIINDNITSVTSLKSALSVEQLYILDQLTKVLLVAPITHESVSQADELLGGLHIGGGGNVVANSSRNNLSLPTSQSNRPKIGTGFNILSSVGKIGQNKQKEAEEAEKLEKERARIEAIPGRSDKFTLHLPDEPPKVAVLKKKKGGKKKYSIQKK